MATAARDKVVTLEQARSASHSKSLLQEDSLLVQPRASSSKLSVGDGTFIQDAGHDSGIDGESVLDELSDLQSEAGDELAPLPEGWPKLPQALHRRSCELSLNVSTCVNKATSHLELLQTIIEEWFGSKDEESAASRVQSKKSLVGAIRPSAVVSDMGKSSPRKQIRFESPQASRSTSTRQSTVSKSSAGSERGLSVQGIGAHIPDSEMSITTSHPTAEGNEMPYLGAEEVITEVMTLLSRLETDRLEAEDILRKERERAGRLANKIDELMEKRMLELPLAVQREHEKCALDLNELAWHVNYKGRNEQRWLHKVNVADVLNKRLKEDIGFVDKHCPLVEEKLQLELEAMRRIEEAQKATDEELAQTQDRERRVMQKSEDAFTRAEQERRHIKQDLDNVRSDLQKISDELAEAKMTYNTYIHQCNDNREQLRDNEQEVLVLQVKSENAKAAERMQDKKVVELEDRICEQEKEHRKFDDRLQRLKSKKDALIADGDQKLSDLSHAIEHKQERLRLLELRNSEAEMIIDDCHRKLTHCKKQKISDEKNLRRIERELERLDIVLDKTMQEFFKTNTICNAVREQLDLEIDKAMKIEETLKNELDSLKKQVKEEIHTRTVIQARIVNDNTDLVKTQAETKHKKGKLSKTITELEEALRIILEKVEKLRAANKEKEEKIQELLSQIDGAKEHHTATEAHVVEKRALLEPKYGELKEAVLNASKRIDYMDWRREMIAKSMADMDRSEGMMSKTYDTTKKKVRELTEIQDELDLQLNEIKNRNAELTTKINEIQARLVANEERHVNHMTEREDVLQKMKDDLLRNLEYNAELASRYRVLQNQANSIKSRLMDVYDRRVHMESTIKDVKQLHGLQRRMHSALEEYYRIRGLHTKTNLNKMENESNKNGVRVGELQTQLDDAIDDISGFLTNNVTNQQVHKEAMNLLTKSESQQKLQIPTTAKSGRPKHTPRKDSDRQLRTPTVSAT